MFILLVATCTPLKEFTGEEPEHQGSNEARSDISACGFWSNGQVVFFDIRVFNPNAARYQNQSVPRTYKANEREKKKTYNKRILEIEHGIFTPLVFSATQVRKFAKFETFSQIPSSVVCFQSQTMSKFELTLTAWVRGC